ncbi:DevB secretion protein [Vulcanococcus limneticus]|uniref:DevB secretion protein n=1 Tax=Vulcanococcus limneticus TaxID=2170428 RepID=UPI000B988361|nr:DevB secretion protein [Vulcanococcus limneticus]MCP9792985.1 DevB secretion protein [Vulcanococcus limneticus MW73D5]MCP9894988.1 DevB secretion protein [Vulcanococcus limneticus Candia 3F8]MCP9898376.1 DevB secretion protein [Vulcanococcus limneticus Candia 3B3]
MAATSPHRGVPRLQRYRPWLIGALLGGMAVLGWTLSRPKPAPSPKAPLVQQVTALGRLTPEGGLVKLAVPAGTSGGSEVVDRWFVGEGAPISKGQLLARLSSYGQLKAMLDQAESNLASTRALLPFLEISKSRGSELYAAGAISEEELAKASASIITKRADIVGARAAVVKARQQLNAAEIRSPLDGNLIRIYSWPGMKETDQGLALIGRTDRMQVWAQVFQSDVPKLRLGQGATVQPESGGFTGSLRADLESIIGVVSDRDLFATNANNDVNARVVLVKLNLAPADRQRVARLSSLNVTVRFDP